ncbi:MAG TPA: hypothetical protein VF824_23060 [Thermoanaerobaculia bacterium]|jgi:hypothetical protein
MTHRYFAYGLGIESNVAIDGMLPPHDGAPSLTLTFESGPPEVVDGATPIHQSGLESFWNCGNGVRLLRYDNLWAPGEGWSLRIDGERLRVRLSENVPFGDVLAVLQGPGLAALLHLRAVPLLHAAVIDAGGRAIAVMGEAGAGKSTTAAAFLRAGHAVLADDVAALDLRDTDVFVHGASSRVRIYAATARTLGWREELPPVFVSEYNDREKRYLDGRTPPHTLPLAAIYLLRARRAGPAAIDAVPAAAALPLLMQQTYAARFLDAAQRNALFRAWTRVAHLVPMRAVQAADALDALPQLVEAIVADAAAEKVAP